MKKIFSFQISTRTVDTVSSSYSVITDTYNSILRSTDQFVSFEIPKGDIVSLLGSNGSGKTTVIRSITGLLDVQNGDITKGSISVDGEDITNEKPSK